MSPSRNLKKQIRSFWFKGSIILVIVCAIYFTLLNILWVKPSLSSVEKLTKKVTIVDNGFAINTTSNRDTVGEVLRDTHFEIFPEDLVIPDLTEELATNSTIYITRATTVQIVDFLGDGKEIRTRAKTVGELLNEIGYEKREDERYEPSADTYLTQNLIVRMFRKSAEDFEQEIDIPYETEYRKDNEMYFNENETIQAGQPGKKQQVYKLVYENDVLIDKTLVSEEVLAEPQTEIIVIGTAIPPGTTYLETGIASFYGRAFDGRRTASGEVFDMNGFTAAHPTLPFGTYVKVTNVNNGKSVIVKITDRGPYAPGRVIDLTEAAFKEISTLGAGVVEVKLEIIND